MRSQSNGRPPDQPIDYSEGSGGKSNTDYDVDTPTEHDDRSKTKTKFNPSEAPPESREQYTRLAKLQDGYRSNDNGGYHTDVLKDAQTWCNHVGATDHQTHRVLHICSEIPIDEYGHDIESVVTAIISLVLNEDERFVQREDDFQDLRDSLDVSSKQFRSARNNVRDVL